ncbi:MAG: phospholipase D-like domain-containing protein [Acidobacteriales bacterium]|nr:phospholipase D-like domain-containing protein [Terriglobales bacterium]
MATLGRAFDHTHPDAIEFFRQLRSDVRIFRQEAGLFHPKVYLFSSGNTHEVAIFIGSSNFTYSGFYSNCEANVLLEGLPERVERAQVKSLQDQLNEWHSDRFSLLPTSDWIAEYRSTFEKTLRKEKKNRIRSPRQFESEISSSSWLCNASWQTFYKEVVDGLKRLKRNRQEYLEVLDAAGKRLSLPWEPSYFEDLELRRIIGGMGEYGWLGHVAASGHFRGLLAHGTRKQWQAISDSINTIGAPSPPVDWARLREALNRLISLGPSMKVWSRLLCLVRPELYCTVASIAVRKNLARTLGVAQATFQSPDGYIRLLKLIHAAPWFQSSMPQRTDESEIWRRRVAFMDAVFYS